jgi:hypothetical protein
VEIAEVYEYCQSVVERVEAAPLTLPCAAPKLCLFRIRVVQLLQQIINGCFQRGQLLLNNTLDNLAVDRKVVMH